MVNKENAKQQIKGLLEKYRKVVKEKRLSKYTEEETKKELRAGRDSDSKLGGFAGGIMLILVFFYMRRSLRTDAPLPSTSPK